VLLLCAGCTSISVETRNDDPCSDYVPAQLWAPTPHAAPPASGADNQWINFGIAEAGQLEKANSDKSGTQHIITTCERKKREAAERAKQQLEPWYKRIF
jgi:hypothetical protein